MLAAKIFLVRYRLFFVNQSKNKHLHVHVKFCEQLHVKPFFLTQWPEFWEILPVKPCQTVSRLDLQNSPQQRQRLDLADCVEKKNH